MRGSFYCRIIVLCWLCLVTLPALGEPEAAFFEVMIEPSVIRLEAELPYSGSEDEKSLKGAADREVAKAFTISPVEGPAISGQLKEARLGPGTRREELSGEAQKEDRTKTRLHGVWEYPYSGKPERLVLRSQMKQPVSFVTRHLGVRLHDTAPLQAEQSLRLDWKDSWYSGFVNPELPRTPSESIACYLYLEPGQTRLEVLGRVRDLETLGKLDFGQEPILSVEKQATLAKQLGELFVDRLGLKMNGQPLELKLEKVQFVRRTPSSADAIDPPEPALLQSAALGAVLVGPAVTEKGTMKLRCELFSPRVSEIPASVIEGEQIRKVKLSPDEEGVIEVSAPPEGKTISPVSAPQGAALGVTALLACGLLVLGAVLMLRFGTGSKAFFLGAVLWLLAGVGALKWGLGPGQSVATDRLQSLLSNIYQAFDAPTEEAVYDRLAISVDGELLSEVFLQTRKGLEAEQGVQVVVERVEVTSAKVTSSDWWGEGMRVRAFWEVSGRVGHWGHEHQRTNLYNADLKLKSVDGEWKLTELEVLDEVRM